MALQFESTQVIDRPINKVFQFYAVEHVRNHPRWDSDIELWLDSDAPIGVGTIIHRRNKRSGTPIEGTMEVTEFETNRSLAMLIHDGPAVMNGRTTFEALNDRQTRITTIIDIPWMDENTDKTFLNSRLDLVAQIRKQLMESEIQNRDDAAIITVLLNKFSPYQWTLIGYGIPAVVLWLMIFKPFQFKRSDDGTGDPVGIDTKKYSTWKLLGAFRHIQS